MSPLYESISRDGLADIAIDKKVIKSGWWTHTKVQSETGHRLVWVPLIFFLGDVFNSISGAPRTNSKTHAIVGFGCVWDSIEHTSLSPLTVRSGTDHLMRVRLVFFLLLLNNRRFKVCQMRVRCWHVFRSLSPHSNVSKSNVSHVQADLERRGESSVAHPRAKAFLCVVVHEPNGYVSGRSLKFLWVFDSDLTLGSTEACPCMRMTTVW